MLCLSLLNKAYSKLFARLSRTQLLPGVALAYFFSWAAVSASDP
ncbi:MAG: hypothetical protein DDT21_02080 [Syntrophomonadaceae bacterium]|nr:hypothetical protein [Bacillota bacterium]